MKTTLHWLGEMLDIPAEPGCEAQLDPDWLADRLTRAGLEVDSLAPLARDSGAVVAEVKELSPHPDSDHLKLCHTSDGERILRIVCGAPNVRRGQKVVLAAPGTVLPSGVEIRARPIRGEVSEGMLCSEKELGLSEEHQGIMVLPADAPLGASVHRYLGLDDWVVEVAVTPNRGDCLSVIGLAREIAALAGGKLRRPRVRVSRRIRDASARERLPVEVAIVDPEQCPRYSARVIHDLIPETSPLWLRTRLEACGIRAINTIVDVTNYVMLETGQPLHAFDLSRITSRHIVVRRAGAVRHLTTLDGVERSLVPDDLLICDGDKPVALAGIMGGRDSEVTGATSSVLLESAHFHPLTIRRTAKRLGLHTEASHRFERGVDPEGTGYAMERALALWHGFTRARALRDTLDAYPRPWQPTSISLRAASMQKSLGVIVPEPEVRRILRALEVRVRAASRKELSVEPPSFRFDISREADIVEEVARVYGYDRIPESLPVVRARPAGSDDTLRWTRKIKGVLAGEGMTEVITLPFTSADINGTFPGLWPPGITPVPVLNPLRQDAAAMRLSLIPALLDHCRTRIEQQSKSVMVFEANKVFATDAAGRFVEAGHLSGLLCGHRPSLGVGANDSPFGFGHLKGVVENVLDAIGIANCEWQADDPVAFLHPGRFARIAHEGNCLGVAGELHPGVREQWDLPRIYLFELDFAKLLNYARADFKVRPLPRFPLVERDLAIVVDENFPSRKVVDWVNGLKQELIEDVVVFDEYRGAPIDRGQKSLAFRVLYRAQDRTLTDEEVNTLHHELTQRLCRDIGAALRQ